jgi:hypothetical protein
LLPRGKRAGPAGGLRPPLPARTGTRYGSDRGCEGRIEVTSAGQSDRACQYRLFMPSGAHKCPGVRSGPALIAAPLR